MKVVVLTTSYPASPGDLSGVFIANAVAELRTRGVEVDVVSPDDFRDFGVTRRLGMVGNLRKRPWLAAGVPAMLGSYALAARRATRAADLVHAHWLHSGAVALTTGRPFVLQVWGTDVELAKRVPRLARAVLSRARVVMSPSSALAEEVRRLGARDVRVIPYGMTLPPQVAEEADPPHVLYAGRLSREKGILELVAAADGMPLVVAGDGQLREQVPNALGFVPHEQLHELYGRAAVVACPSRREGFGMACAEAMAHGRPVVASAVGGLRDLVVDGETGVLVPPRDVPALREALESLLADPARRRKLGEAARERIREHFSWERFASETVRAYKDALSSNA